MVRALCVMCFPQSCRAIWLILVGKLRGPDAGYLVRWPLLACSLLCCQDNRCHLRSSTSGGEGWLTGRAPRLAACAHFGVLHAFSGPTLMPACPPGSWAMCICVRCSPREKIAPAMGLVVLIGLCAFYSPASPHREPHCAARAKQS